MYIFKLLPLVSTVFYLHSTSKRGDLTSHLTNYFTSCTITNSIVQKINISLCRCQTPDDAVNSR